MNTATSSATLRLIVLAAALAGFMSALDGTIVNIALPTISEIFNLSSSSVSWVSTIYLLVMAGSLLVVGKLIDLIGFRKIFLTGFLLFTFGSFACGFFPELTGSFALLLVARVLQALGGVMMTVIGPAMLTKYMPGVQRAKGIATVILFASLGTALGPTLGGLLTEFMSWNWIFYINVPVGIFTFLLGFFVLPKDEVGKFTLKGFDGVGAVLIFAGLAFLLYAFAEGMNLGWTSLPILASIVLAVLCIGGFLICESRHKNPILDLSLFKNVSFLLVNVALSLVFFVIAGAQYLLPFYFQIIKGMTTFEAGLVLSVLSVGMMISGLIAGQVYAKMVGKIRILLLAGVGALALGFFLLSKLNPFSELGIVIAGLFLIGFGTGLVSSCIATLAQGSVKPEKSGMVASITSLERFAPMTIGIAFFNMLLVAGVTAIVKNSGITTKPMPDIAASILVGGFDICFFAAMILSIAAFVMCLFIKEANLKP